MSKVLNIAAGLAVLPVLAFSAPAFADSPGQLGSGDGTMVVKNITQNGTYAASAPVACDNTLQYSVRIHNTEFGELKNIVVKATLGSTTSIVATTSAGGTTGTNASVTNTLANGQTLSYVKGSATLYNDSKAQISGLSGDDITGSGVTIDQIDGSTTKYLNFQAKVNCTTPTTPTTPTTTTTPGTPAKPTTLVNTGAGSVVGIFAGVAAVAALAYNIVLRRQNAR